MQAAVILGHGATARETLSWLRERFDILGFLDDESDSEDVIGKVSDWVELDPGTALVSSFGNYETMAQRMRALGAIPAERFPVVISERAIVYSELASYGVFVCPRATITSDVSLAQHVTVFHHALVCHDVSVGEFSIIANAATVSGSCRIGRNCYIGAGATLIEDVSVGDGSLVAAGATVSRTCPRILFTSARARSGTTTSPFYSALSVSVPGD